MRAATLFALWVLCTGALPQEGFRTLRQTGITGRQVYSDEMGNIYVVSGTRLNKYDLQGNFLYSFSDKTRGEIDFVDTGDPLKTFLFHRAFSQVEFLDNTLTVNGNPINLKDLGLDQATLACASYDNGFWTYSPGNFELIRVDRSLRLSHRSGNLSELAGFTPDPVSVAELQDYLLLNDTSRGILVLDKYGTYLKTLPLKNVRTMQGYGGRFIFLDGQKVAAMDIKTGETIVTPLTGIRAENASLCFPLKRIYALTPDGLVIYSFL